MFLCCYVRREATSLYHSFILVKRLEIRCYLKQITYRVGREESGQDIILPSIVTHSSRPSDRRVGHDGKPIKSGKHDKKKSGDI